MGSNNEARYFCPLANGQCSVYGVMRVVSRGTEAEKVLTEDCVIVNQGRYVCRALNLCKTISAHLDVGPELVDSRFDPTNPNLDCVILALLNQRINE